MTPAMQNVVQNILLVFDLNDCKIIEKMLLDILLVCVLVNWQSTVLYQLKRRVLREVQSKKKHFAAIKEIQETIFGFRRRDIQQMSEKNVLWIYLTAKYEPDAVSFVTSSVTELVILSAMRHLETETRWQSV